MLSSQSNLIQATRVIAILFINNVCTINTHMHLFIYCQSAGWFVIRFWAAVRQKWWCARGVFPLPGWLFLLRGCLKRYSLSSVWWPVSIHATSQRISTIVDLGLMMAARLGQARTKPTSFTCGSWAVMLRSAFVLVRTMSSDRFGKISVANTSRLISR